MVKAIRILGLLFFFYLGVVLAIDFDSNDFYKIYYNSFDNESAFVRGFVWIYRVFHMVASVLGWLIFPLIYVSVVEKFEEGGLIK